MADPYMTDPYVGKELYPFDFESYQQRKREGQAVEDIQRQRPPGFQERFWGSLPPEAQNAATIGSIMWEMNKLQSPMGLISQLQDIFPILSPLHEKRYKYFQGSGGKRPPLIGE